MPSPVRRSTRGALPLSKSAPSGSTTSSSSTSSSKPIRKAVRAPKSSSLYGVADASPGFGSHPRRSQRAHQSGEEEEADEAGEDDVTRCICGYPTYEGPPRSEAFEGMANELGQLNEDLGDMFIQCDGCGVWQHGGCVGIIEEEQCPDKYYCEFCKPKLHTLKWDSSGRQYSLWVPLHPQFARKSSTSRSDDKSKRERESTAGRASADPVTGRRRATMRSKEHDDEEEQLQRALEESKKVNEPAGGKRNGKRSREESEDTKQDSKRPRMVSEAMTTSGSRTADDDSDDDVSGAPMSKSKKAKADAATSARQAELKEKESEREKARADAANRRLERAGRRRVDDEPDDTPQPSKASPPLGSSQPPSPQSMNAQHDKVSHKKGMGGKRVKKLGNNQYTKHRGADQAPASSPHGRKRLLHSAMADSGDEQSVANGESGNGGVKDKGSPAVGGAENHNTNGVGKKFGKGKRTNLNGWHAARHQQQHSDEPVELTYANMKRSLDGMLVFIQRQQIESHIGTLPPGSSQDRSPLESAANIEGPSPGSGGPVHSPQSIESKPFEDMTSTEMAELISQRVEVWRGKYGHLHPQAQNAVSSRIAHGAMLKSQEPRASIR